ncbi:MAG: hypothetical protein INQ03_21535 [Candidatus Heimdallarchaeota archaeon]|nr:hypothetical protein [Candidatus Heimdallarchaeota archaeon]
MSFEERIYEKLRAVASTKKMTRSDASDRELRRARAHRGSEYQEKLSDFTPAEIKQLLIEEQIAKKFLGLIGSGKEANVYHIKDFKNRYLAVKMFRVHSTTHNFNALHVRGKLSHTAKLGIATRQCSREYENLGIAHQSGDRSPKPIWRKGFLYAAEMVGGKYPSPLLTDINLEHEELDPIEVLDDALEQLDILFNKGNMVHGDYLGNLLLDEDDNLQVIDFYQSKRWHPDYDTPEKIMLRNALPILKRDIESLLGHFKSKYRISYDPEVVFENLPETKVADHLPTQLMEEDFDVNLVGGDQIVD